MNWMDTILRPPPAPNNGQPGRLREPWKILHDHSASAEDIYFCFRLILGRSPNPEEWPGHSARTGADLDSVIGSYLGSLEFSRRMEGIASQRFDRQVLLRTLQGFRLYVQASDLAVGLHITDGGNYEPHVTAAFRRLIRPGMNVLDVGANIGYFTMLAASLTQAKGSVMAIEPNPGNMKLLEASRRINGFDHVTLVQAAAARELGLLVLHTAHSNGTTSPPAADLPGLLDAVTVAALRIDDLLPAARQIDFIKIDVEGAEYNALQGATELIRRCRPVIVSEFSPDQMPMISGVPGTLYLQLLIGFGYQASVLNQDGSVRPCGTDTGLVMQAYQRSGVDHIDILFEPV
jgi:FkbM family methyltransferase